MNKEIKVDFFVVGAQKAGTTSLHDWILPHPELSLPQQKETHFFSNDKYYQKGFNWYKQQFTTNFHEKVCGEVCPEYLFFDKACERIYQHNPQAKIIIILRNPIQRALSQYKMNLRSGLAEGSFFAEIQKEFEKKDNEDFYQKTHFSYIQRSLYSQQIQRFQKLFGKNNVLCLNFSELISDDKAQGELLKRICSFIGIGSNFQFNTQTKSNVSSKPKFEIIRNILYKENILKKVLRPLLAKNLRSTIALKVDSWNQKPSSYSELQISLPQFLKPILLEDIALTEHLTGFSFPHWKKEIENTTFTQVDQSLAS